MKRLLLLGVGSALMFTMGGVGSAQADTDTNPIHKSTAVAAGTTANITLGGSRCASCHRAHTAKAEYLLKQAQPGLCYTCHSSLGSVLNVVDGVDPNTAAGSNALRGGGFAYALIDGAAGSMTVTAAGAKSSTAPAGTVAAPVTSRHQIDGSTQGTMWGNGAVSATVGDPLAAGKTGVTLECGSCHDPHGNGNYRILKPIPNDAATKAVTAAAAIPAVLGTDGVTVITPAVPAVAAVAAVVVLPVVIPDAAPGARKYTTTDYWDVNDATVPNVTGAALPNAAGVPDGYIQNVAAWCSTCHTRYLAGSGAWKTPNAGYVAGATGVNGTGTNATTGPIDSTFTYRHRSESAGYVGKARPNCIQCHVSHGTSATMSGSAASYTAPDGSVPATMNSRLLRVNDRTTCKMCHNV